MFTTVLWFLVALCVLVAVHEYGHFYAARRCGVKVLRFSIGFGHRLFKWTDKRGTEWAFSAIPLGGYVKMLDEREGDVSAEERHLSFNAAKPWQKIFIAFAGPLANIILSVLLYWLLFAQGTVGIAPVIGTVEKGSVAYSAKLEPGQEIVAIDGHKVSTQREVAMVLLGRLGESGKIRFSVRYQNSDLIYESEGRIDKWLQGEENPDPLKGLGIEFFYPPITREVAYVSPDSAAEAGGVEVGDVFLFADSVSLDSWETFRDYVSERPGQEIRFEIERDDKRFKLDIVPREYKKPDGSVIGLVGVRPKVEAYPEGMVKKASYSFTQSFIRAVEETQETSSFVLLSMKKLLVGEISIKNLSGPIGIAKVAGDSARSGAWTFLQFLAMISVYLGVLNLLPIPILDGGHIIYGIVEWISGSPVSEKIQMIGNQLGLAMVLCVMVIAFYNDILRL